MSSLRYGLRYSEYTLCWFSPSWNFSYVWLRTPGGCWTSPSFSKLDQLVAMRNRKYNLGNQRDWNIFSLITRKGSNPSLELGHTFFYPKEKICKYFVCSHISFKSLSSSHSMPNEQNEQHEVIAKEMLRRWNVDNGKSIIKHTEGEEAEIYPYELGEEEEVLLNKVVGSEPGSGLLVNCEYRTFISRLISFFSPIALPFQMFIFGCLFLLDPCSPENHYRSDH
ncbi:hypothetical protein DFH11DRAFT_1589068 [Phellopilus nigrolimitatus]|nr:hypothetical protein DFH11DRAFT_1589068 [Phellopilus nigrolimitatus]